MNNFDIKKLEKKLRFNLYRNCYVLGVDLASTTGLAIIKTTDKKLELDTTIIKLPSADKEDDRCDQYVDKMAIILKWIRDFKKGINPKNKTKSILVLENSYLGFNAYTFGQLKMMGGICFAELFDLFDIVEIIFATTARKTVGFKSQLKRGSVRKDKKLELIKFINDILGANFESDDICDAIILALAGLKEKDD